MTISLLDQAATPAIPRDQWGRYLITPADGSKAKGHTRATTLAKSVSDSFGLTGWKLRVLICALRDNPDLIDRAAGLDFDNGGHKQTLTKIADDGHELAGGNAKAELGTLIHSLTERADKDGQGLRWDDYPGEHIDTISAYLDTLDTNGVHVHPEWIERVVVLPDIEGGVAGTFDRLVTVDGYDLPIVADIKTGGLNYAACEIAIQLALYANASTMWTPGSDTHEPMPEVDRERGIVIHLPPDGEPSLHWVDIAAGWEAVQLCVAVREWRKQGNSTKRKPTTLLTPFAPAKIATPDEPQTTGRSAEDRRVWLTDRIKVAYAAHQDTLIAQYKLARVAHPELPEALTPDFDDAHTDILAEVCDAVEREHDDPFGDTDPAVTAARETAQADTPPEPTPPPRLVRNDDHDEGVIYTEDDAGDPFPALKRDLEALSAEVTDTMLLWRSEAAEHGIVWNCFGRRSQRALEQMRAAMTLAEACNLHGDDTARVALGIVIGEETQQAIPVGAYIGNLSTTEAIRLHEVAVVLANGGTAADALAVVA